jgi:hypothetical protein
MVSEDPHKQTISEYFGLGVTQGALDFADVPANGDIRLYIDPFALSSQRSATFVRWHDKVQDFFGSVVAAIREGNVLRARELMQHLKEPNETRLGQSRGRPRGTGADGTYAERILRALTESTAVKTGLITNLEETELMVEGVSYDRISDLATNILRGELLTYTQEQCALHHIPMERVSVGWVFNIEHEEWEMVEADLPVTEVGGPNRLLLVPKRILRHQPSYDADHFYRHEVLSYQQGEELRNNSGLVRIMKGTGERKVHKKDVEARYPFSKEYLADFARRHPEVLAKYRDSLAKTELERIAGDDLEYNWRALAEFFRSDLTRLQAGNEDASAYHRLIAGVLEFAFYPSLWRPQLEQEIHQGRKRIDIQMENNSRFGIFATLPQNSGLPCVYVPIECKNYSDDPQNPELDQLIGRLSGTRGRIGILVCRTLANRPRFVERCRDTLRDGHGLIIPLADRDILGFLDSIVANRRDEIDTRLRAIADEIFNG